MASTNGITGDSLVNKPNSKEYEDNYDRIFRNGIEKPNEDQFNGNVTNTSGLSKNEEGKLPTSTNSGNI